MKYVVFIVATCAIASAGPGSGQDQSAAANAKIIAWAKQNIANYKRDLDYAKHGKPQVPVPPQIDPPCHSCDMTSPSQGETDVTAWVAQSEKPEIDYIKDLAAIARQLELLNDGQADFLSPAAVKALAQFSSSEATAAMAKIAGKLRDDKAIPMANHYDKDPKRAYAGISFLLASARDATLVIGGSAAENNDDQVMQLVSTWEQSIYDTIDKDIFANHKYNLCPVYAEVARTVELLGGKADVAALQAAVQKMDKFLRFDVTMDLHVTGNSGDSHVDLSWRGTTKLHLTIDWTKGCYTPTFDPNTMNVSVQGFTMTNKEGPVELVSPRSFTVPMVPPKLNLCDPNPVLAISFDATKFPQDEVMAKGRRAKGMLFGEFMMAVIALNALNQKDANAVTGNNHANDAPPPAQGSGASDAAATQAQIEQHKGDPAWLMSAEGQAAIAKLQKQAMSQVGARVAPYNATAGAAANLADMQAAFGAARVNWANGSTSPGNQTLKVDKDGNHIQLTITVKQASQ